MGRIKQHFKRIRNCFTDFSVNEWIVFLLVLSTFVSVYLLGAVILLLPFYIFISKQKKHFIPKNSCDYFVLVFAFVAFLSTLINSVDIQLENFLIKSEYLKLLGVGVIVLSFDIFYFVNTMTKRAFEYGLKLASTLSISSFLVALYQRIFHIYASPSREGRYASIFMNENYYGNMIEFLVLICLYCIFRSKTKREKALHVTSLLCNLFGLWLCQSRTSYIVVAITLFIFLFICKRKVSFALLGFFILFGLFVLYFPDLLPRIESTGSYLDFRLGIWDSALKAFLDSPILGRGYYSYGAVWKEYSQSLFYAMHTHNLYLEILLNFGLVGGLSIGAYSVSNVFRSVKTSFGSKDLVSLSLIISLTAAILIRGMADTTLFWPQTGFLAVLVLCNPNVFRFNGQDNARKCEE